MAQLKPFWGLVEQVGPWQTTTADRKRSSMKDKPTMGGGIEAGGRANAGHGEWKKVFTPYQNDSSPSLPKPSDYAMRSVVTGPVDMKRQTKMGRVKKGLTMAARTPLQSGEKMGMSTQTENIEMGQRLGTEPGQVLPDLIAESVASEYGVETSTGETQTEIDTAVFMTQTPTRPTISQTSQTAGPSLSIKKTGFQGYRPRRGVQATQTQERSFKDLGTQVVGTAAAATLGFIAADVGGAMVAGKKTWDYLAPQQPNMMDVDVPTYKPPPVNLALSDSFMKSIIDYEEGQKVKRKQKMVEGYKERVQLVKDRKAVPVPTGEGKKLAMSEKALGKLAEKRGLPEAAKAAGIIPEKAMKTNGIKIKPLKKKTMPGVSKIPGVSKKSSGQPVTQKVLKALRKRIGDAKINRMVKTMKETNPQYKIFKAANEQWLKEK